MDAYDKRYKQVRASYEASGFNATLRYRLLFKLNGLFVFLQNSWRAYDIGFCPVAGETVKYVSFGPLVLLW